jgi:hypothetical protein
MALVTVQFVSGVTDNRCIDPYTYPWRTNHTQGGNMYIFNRSAPLNRMRQFEATSAAIDVAAMATAITGTPVSVFGTRFGAPLNTIGWSGRFESQSALQTMTEKLLADSGYVEWVSTHGDLFESAAIDQLTNIVSSTLAGEPKRFYSVLTAAAENGKLADALAFGVKAQAFVAKATGLATAFGTAVYGPFGTVGWLTGADSMDDLDRLVDMQMTNKEYQALVQEAGPLFAQGSGTTSLIEKLN